MRGTAAGLGRLARDACVLGVIGGSCFAAAGADASPAPQLFKLSFSATAVADFDHTSAPVTRQGCESSLRAEGTRTAVFHSSRPTLVRVVGGRIQTVVARGLAGTVKLSGTNTSKRVCAGGETQTPENCAATTRTFRNARVTFSSTARGSITIRPPSVSLRKVDCPQEPDDLLELPLGPAPGPLRVSVATLTSPLTTRITGTASARRTKTYKAPEAGAVRQRTSWRITLVRTGR